MTIHTYLPAERLTPFIRKYLVIECEEERVNRVLPDTSLVMAFRYKGRVSYLADDGKKDLPFSVISGLRKSGRMINYSNNSGNILVIFRETGARAFIKEPLYELFEESVALGSFDSYRDLSRVEEQLAEAACNVQRIALVERFLLSKLYRYPADALIAAALERIGMAKGIVKIKELADTLCISLDAFEKRFRREVGVSPKQFSYIIRMKSIVNDGLKKQTFTETAFDAGYFDQPHFNKDFKLFTGQNPSDFLKSPIRW